MKVLRFSLSVFLVIWLLPAWQCHTQEIISSRMNESDSCLLIEDTRLGPFRVVGTMPAILHVHEQGLFAYRCFDRDDPDWKPTDSSIHERFLQFKPEDTLPAYTGSHEEELRASKLVIVELSSRSDLDRLYGVYLDDSALNEPALVCSNLGYMHFDPMLGEGEMTGLSFVLNCGGISVKYSYLRNQAGE